MSTWDWLDFETLICVWKPALTLFGCRCLGLVQGWHLGTSVEVSVFFHHVVSIMRDAPEEFEK